MKFSVLAVRYFVGIVLCVIPALIALFTVGVSSSTIIVTAFVSLLLASLTATIITSRFAGSVLALERATERLAQGELTARVYPSRTPQLARLASGFNSMASILKARVDALTRLSAEQDAILRGMAEGVITVTKNGRIARINEAALAFLDVAVSDWKERLVAEVIHHAAIQRFISSALRSEETLSEVVVILGPTERILQMYSSPLHDSETELGRLIVLQDITRLERLERVRKDFIANVSHELRTPITAIKGYVETLLDGAKDDPATLIKFLGVIGRQADRLQDIFSDLLTLAQLEAKGDNARTEVVPTEARIIIQSALDAIQTKFRRKDTHFTVAISEDTQLLANPRLLQQALVNLIDNAITYSGETPSISIKASSNATHVCFSVSDDGPGIPKVHLSRLFERFYRIDTGRSREMGGTGLGLAIVKHIAQVHGGTVDVQSTPGAGSTFLIAIPRQQEKS